MFLGYMVLKPKQACDAFGCKRQAVWRLRWKDDIGMPIDYYCDEHKPKVERL